MCHAATRAAVLVGVLASSVVACTSGELAAPDGQRLTDPDRLSVSIGIDRDSIAYGAERQYSASVLNQRNEPRPASVAWSSTNPSVVNVSNGRVQAVGAGSAQIIAAIPGHADTALITVYGVITKLAVVPEVVLIPEGEELRFQADVGQVPGAATSYVHWATTDSLVAKVKDDGTLTAVSAGSAELVATYGSTVGRAAVRVFTSPVASITIKPGASNLAAGSTVKLDAQLWDANSRRLMGRQVSWSSSSESLARVDADGVVTGVSKGVAYITAESEGKRSSAAMVVGPRPVSSVSVTIASTTLSVSQMTQVIATVLDAAGQAIPPSEQPVFWQSANPTVANVTGAGVVFAVAVGRTTISALAGGKTASVEVEVVNRQAQSVVIVPANPSVLQGAAVQLAAEVRDQNGVAMSGMSVTWSSGNPAVATITSSGMVTGVASGTVQITATSGSLKGTATLTVSGVPVASVSISPTSLALDPGASSTMTATPRDASGQPLSGRVITWSSSNPTVATVSSTGKVTAVAVGTVSVTATSEGKSAQASVTVNQPAPAPVATVSVSLNSPSLLPGQTTQARATLFDANGRLLTERVVTWSSSDPALATVSATGLVTAKSAGTVTIIATSEGKSGAASLTIELTAPAPVATVTLTLSPKSIQAGQTSQASVTLKDAQGNTLTGRTVGYSSSNSGVAAVSASGTVTGKSAGSAAIVATSEGKTGADTATVTGGTPVATRVSVTATKPSIDVGQTGNVSATVYDQAGNVMTGVTVTWSSSNSSVVRTSTSNEYFAVASGTATITGTTSNGVSGGIGITVLGSTTTVAPVATVSVSLTSVSLLVGQTTQAMATLKDANGNVLSGRSIAWSSSNGAVATVTQSGVVTAVGAGTAQIIAASEGKSGAGSVTVTAVTTVPNRTGSLVIPAVVQTFNQVGTGLVSSGFPMRPGDLWDADVAARQVCVWVSGVEVPAYVEALRGRFPDGSVRSLLVQFTANLASLGSTPSAELRIGPVCGQPSLPKTVVSATLVSAARVIIATDPVYLSATWVTFQPVVPATQEDAANRAYFTTFFDARFEALKTSELNSGWYQSTYESGRALFAAWQKTGNAKYWHNGVQRAYALLTGYTLPATTVSIYTPHPNVHGLPGVSSSGLPSESHSQRYVTFGSAYLLTGLEEFWNVVSLAAQWGSARITSQAMAIDPSGYVHRDYYGRFNVMSTWALALGVVIDATRPYSGSYGPGRQMDYAVQLPWVLDAWEAAKYTTGDYRDGLRGTRQTTTDGGTEIAGELPVFQIALLADWLTFYYYNVKADARIPAWVKRNVDIMLATVVPLQSGEPGYGQGATYGYGYNLKASGPGRQGQVAQPWTLPMFADALAFVYATTGDPTYLTWYQRAINPGNVAPSHLNWGWKIFGESFGYGTAGPYLVVRGLPPGLPTSIRTPTRY